MTKLHNSINQLTTNDTIIVQGSNCAAGVGALVSLTSGSDNTAIGSTAMGSSATSSGNTACGSQCLTNNTGLQNTGVGFQCLTANTSGRFLTSVGAGTLNGNTTAERSTAIGYNALVSVNGTWNTALGYFAGTTYIAGESSNIVIGHNGNHGDSNLIRIGTQGVSAGQQSQCFIAGITGSTPAPIRMPQVVVCDSAGNLTVLPSGTSGQILVSNGTSTPSFQTGSTLQNVTPVSSSPYTVLSTDQILSVDTTSTPITVDLPNTTTTGRVVTIKDVAGTAATNNITLTTPGGTVTFDGSTSRVMNSNYQSVTVYFNGTNYSLI